MTTESKETTTRISRLDAINYLRKNPDDHVFAAMFHDIRIDIFNEDPIANPLAHTFSCTRQDWIYHGPSLLEHHPIHHITFLEVVPSDRPNSYPPSSAYLYVPSTMDSYNNFVADDDTDDIPPIWIDKKSRGDWILFCGEEEAYLYISRVALSWALRIMRQRVAARLKGRGGKEKAILPPLYITPDNKGSFLHVPSS